MRKIVMPIMVGLLCVCLAGCSHATFSKLPWLITVHEFETASTVNTNRQTLHPTPGYQWLILNVTVSNRTAKTEMLNPIIYEFELVLSSNHYVNGLIYDNPLGAIEWVKNVQPGQSISGDIYFEVPSSVGGLSGARIIMRDILRGHAWGSDISNVPRR